MIARPLIVDNPVDGRVGNAPAQPVGQGTFDPTVPYPTWKLPIKIDPRTHENFLFHRASDPDQTNNLWDSHVEERERMLSLLTTRLIEEGCPPEQFDRLGLAADTAQAAE